MNPETNRRTEFSSRDPAGFLFLIGGVYHRAVNRTYLGHLQHLYDSGLYERLTGASLLLPFSELKESLDLPEHPKVLLPEQLDFVSYPFEWSFSQLKDAALATLDIQRIALEHGATLKDATPYNIQLVRGRMCLIDSLSFEKYTEGAPWKAYRQFCETFLAPLLWASRAGAELLPAQSVFLEGIPLPLASALLPRTTWLSVTAFCHIHLHARASRYSESKKLNESRITVSKKSSQALIESLRSGVQSLALRQGKSEWSDYYASCNYSSQAFESKKAVVETWLDRVGPKSAWDLGANTGEFSRLLGRRGVSVIAADIDPLCVDQLYRSVREERNPALHPLRVNLVNPPPAVGWMNRERPSLLERGGRRDLVLALALIHHLCLGKNISFTELGRLFRQLGKWVVAEFVPRSDPQSQRLLRTRPDIFDSVSEPLFLKTMSEYFRLEDTREVGATGRTLHLFQSHE